MNLQELRAFTLVAILGGLSFWPAALSTPPAEARAHQPESTRALDSGPLKSGGARAVPPSGGDLRLHTEGKLEQRAGLTPRKDAGFACCPSNHERDGMGSTQGERGKAESYRVHPGTSGLGADGNAICERCTTSGSNYGPTSRPALRQMASDAAELCGVPVALFHALIERESSWRPHVVSRSGAVGLAQVKPSTARGVSPTLDVREPWQNLVAGACYLRQQFDRFGTWRKALHAYRLGPAAVVTRTAREYASDIMGSAQ